MEIGIRSFETQCAYLFISNFLPKGIKTNPNGHNNV